MNKREFALLMERDGGCVHCGETEAVAPNHRINRGMGGASRLADRSSNLVVLCSVVNGLIESDPEWRAQALECGWKLERWQQSAEIEVYDQRSGIWYLLDDDWQKWPL
jgi:hypothetical protein